METWPEDPLKYVHDYFGNYRDPMWDQVDDWKKENQEMTDKIPELENQISEMKQKVAKAK